MRKKRGLRAATLLPAQSWHVQCTHPASAPPPSAACSAAPPCPALQLVALGGAVASPPAQDRDWLGGWLRLWRNTRAQV